MDTRIQPVITKAKGGPYRQHGEEFKRAAIARTLLAGASVSLIARELKINTNQLFIWRKRFGGEVPASGDVPGQLVAVTVLDTSTSRTPAPIPAVSAPPE